MEDYTICSQACWLDHFLEQKLYFSILSSTSDQARLCSGDGFSVSLPAHLLLAASKLARSTFIPGLAGQDLFLPSVRGSTLLLLVEILRSGRTSSLGEMDELGYMLKEVQVAMALLEVPGCTALMRDNSKSSRFKSAKIMTTPSMLHHLSREKLPCSITPVEEVAQMTTSSSSLNDDPNSLSVNENNNLSILKVKDEQAESEMSGLEDELIDQVKENTIPVECNVCKKQFTKQKSLSMHIRGRHREVLFSCEHCDKKFISECNLKKHVVGSHKGDRISCEYCPSTFSLERNLERHVKTLHKDLLDLVDNCDDNFEQNGNGKENKQESCDIDKEREIQLNPYFECESP